MRNNSNKDISKNPKTSVRNPAARQGAAKPVTLAERREKAVIKLPEERRKGTKYQVIRGQYLRQANKKENINNTNAAAIKMAAAKQEEKQEKAKRQTAAAATVKNEKNKTSPSNNVSHDSSSINTDTAASEAKEKYAKSTKAEEYTERLQTNIDLSKGQNEYAKSVGAGEYTERLKTSIDLSKDQNEYAKSVKVEEYAKRLQTNIDLSKAVNIPPSVTWEQVLDNSVKKDSVYSQGGTAQERALQYKEKADFYLNKMKKNAETGQKEVNPNRDKEVGELYTKAYKLAHKEELLGKKNSTLFDKAQSVIQVKTEVDNALNKDSTGEAVAAAAAIPFAHAATKAVRKLAVKNKVVNAGKTGFELAAKVTEGAAVADGVGEATVNVVLAAPKYAVQKKVEKTVQQVIQNQHDRKLEAQRERLREKQEKVEKRAQQMKKENMQRNMKVDLYKSEHGMGSNGNVLQKAKSAVKAALDGMKRAVQSLKSLKLLLFAGGGVLPIIFIVIIIAILVVLVLFPFFYTSKDGKEDEIQDSTFGETIQHYYEVMDEVVDKFNAEIDEFLHETSEYDNSGVENPSKKAQYDSDYAEYQTQYDSYITDYDNYCVQYPENSGYAPEAPERDYWYTYDELSSKGMERGPIFEGFVWDDESDATRVPKGKLYDEMLCTISTYNTKLMSRPESIITGDDENNTENDNNSESGEDSDVEDTPSPSGSGDIIFMNDENVAAVYGGSDFWEFKHWEEGVDCPSGGNCCSKTVQVSHYDDKGNFVGYSMEEEAYCPTHYVIMWGVWLDFDLDRIWESYNFDEEDEENYEEVKENFDKEKENAGIT